MKKYLYNLNYPVQAKDLCFMEMRFLFKDEPCEKHLISYVDVNPSRSPFIKERMEIQYDTETLDEMVDKINDDGLCADDFKVFYMKLERREVGFEERMDALRRIGTSIIGRASIHEPKVVFALTNLNGRWLFGKYEKNDYKWHEHDRKPHSYSNSISLRLSRAIVNIAVENDRDIKLIDPCCGVGTVVLDALSMGIDAEGWEINPLIAKNAKENMEYFGYDDVITMGDMKDIDRKYDVAVIDIPYGLYTYVYPGEQEEIICKAGSICRKLVLISYVRMDKLLESAGFRIIDSCIVRKGSVNRHISVCLHN